MGAKLSNWSAKRAGGRITIEGVDAKTGKPLKIVGIERVEPDRKSLKVYAYKEGSTPIELLVGG